MDLNSLLHPSADTVIYVVFTVGVSFITHKAVMSAFIRASSRALNHLADFVDTSDPGALKLAMTDAETSIELVKKLDIAAAYQGVSPKSQDTIPAVPVVTNSAVSFQNPQIVTPQEEVK